MSSLDVIVANELITPSPTPSWTLNPTPHDFGEQTENPTPTIFDSQTESPVFTKLTFHPTGSDAFLRKTFNPTPTWRKTEAPTEEYLKTENPTISVPIRTLNPTLLSMMVTAEPTESPTSITVTSSPTEEATSILETSEPTATALIYVPVRTFNPTLSSMLVTPEPTAAPSTASVPIRTLNPTLLSMMVTSEPTESPTSITVTSSPTEEALSIPVRSLNPTLISMWKTPGPTDSPTLVSVLETPEPTAAPSTASLPIRSLNPTLISMWKSPGPTDSPSLALIPTQSPTEETILEPSAEPTSSVIMHKTSLPTHSPVSVAFTVSQVFDGVSYSAYLTEITTFKYVIEESVAETIGNGLTYSDVYITSVIAYSTDDDNVSRKLRKSKAPMKPKKIFTFTTSANSTDDESSTSSLLVSYQVDATSMEGFGGNPYYDDTYGGMAATLIKAVNDGQFTETVLNVATEVGAKGLESLTSSAISVTYPAIPTLTPTLEPTNEDSRAPTDEKSHSPSVDPSRSPIYTSKPTHLPTYEPTFFPSVSPTTLLPTVTAGKDTSVTVDVFAATGAVAVLVFILLLFPYFQLGVSNMARSLGFGASKPASSDSNETV